MGTSSLIHEGDRAPEFSLLAVGGGQVALKDFRGRPAQFIFIRHLG